MAWLKLEGPKTTTWRYDKEADTLYISFDGPRPSLTLDLGNGTLARYLKETGEITGITLLEVSKALNSSEQL